MFISKDKGVNTHTTINKQVNIFNFTILLSKEYIDFHLIYFCLLNQNRAYLSC